MKQKLKNIISLILLFVYMANMAINLLPAMNYMQEVYFYKRICFKKADLSENKVSLNKKDTGFFFYKVQEKKKEKKTIQFCSSKDYHEVSNILFHSVLTEADCNYIQYLSNELIEPCCVNSPPPNII